jgi:NAD(P)-dependent dehydrogenase (short-subunit alcohol dehydrogenase family)
MSANQRLKGRIAVVTGAARGIGEAISRRLAAEGATVCLADIDEHGVEDLRKSLDGSFSYRVDIGSQESVDELAQHLADQFGCIDILVNNAAILDMSPLESLTFARYSEVIGVNLNGALRTTLAVLRLLKRRRQEHGRILNIASVMGFRGSRHSLAYSTAKGGLINLTRCLACDLADDGITVNAIAPGFIDTRMSLLPDGSGHEHQTEWFKEIYIRYRRIPVGRPGDPVDIAGPAFFFCSDDSRYVTGQVLPVDGGMSATF